MNGVLATFVHIYDELGQENLLRMTLSRKWGGQCQVTAHGGQMEVKHVGQQSLHPPQGVTWPDPVETLTLTTLEIVVENIETGGFFQFKIIINVYVSFFCLI